MNELTKREKQIMDIFWSSDKPLSSNEVKNMSNDLSIHTIQQVLRRLNNSGFIKVEGVGFTKNSITRKYSVAISQAKYLKSFIAKKTSFELAMAFIEENDDMEMIDELANLIQKKREKKVGN